MGSVSTERVGIAGGIHGTMRHLGSLTGIAIVGSYFTARRNSLMEGYTSAVNPEQIATASFLGALHAAFFSFPSHIYHCSGHIYVSEINQA